MSHAEKNLRGRERGRKEKKEWRKASLPNLSSLLSENKQLEVKEQMYKAHAQVRLLNRWSKEFFHFSHIFALQFKALQFNLYLNKVYAQNHVISFFTLWQKL